MNYSIKITKIQEKDLPKNIEWRYKKSIHCGNRIDVVKMSNKPRCHIQNLPGRKYKRGYWNKDKEFVPEDSRIHNKQIKPKAKGENMRNERSLKKIFKDMNRLICANFTGKKNELFWTLTYSGELQTDDHVKIHKDFKNFWDRLKYAYPAYELAYISIVEPHESGNWHIHLLLKSLSRKTLFIDVDDMRRIWGNGNAHLETIKSDDIGSYFVAYFTNMEINPEDVATYSEHYEIETKNDKKYIKGLRLKFYPDNMQIYRYSRNITQPTVKMNDYIPNDYERTFINITNITDDETIKTNPKFNEITKAQKPTDSYTVIEQYKKRKK